MPFFSIYCATKAAIKMFTESLAYEMADWGVKVSLIAPAGFKTGKNEIDYILCPCNQGHFRSYSSQSKGKMIKCIGQ